MHCNKQSLYSMTSSARVRNCDAERFDGLEVDHQLELRGLLNWKIAGLARCAGLMI
jgi:hypothetical protein